MKKLSLLTVLSLVLCGLASAQYDRRSERPENERITNGPVVETTGDTWTTIAWSTNTGGSSIVHYGRHWDHLSRSAQAPYADDDRRRGQTHRVTINNLRPGTTYYFAVYSGQGEGTGTEAWSGVNEFTTRW
jgi:hypothetical protein